jgi:hypothetical protein
MITIEFKLDCLNDKTTFRKDDEFEVSISLRRYRNRYDVLLELIFILSGYETETVAKPSLIFTS